MPELLNPNVYSSVVLQLLVHRSSILYELLPRHAASQSNSFEFKCCGNINIRRSSGLLLRHPASSLPSPAAPWPRRCPTSGPQVEACNRATVPPCHRVTVSPCHRVTVWVQHGPCPDPTQCPWPCLKALWSDGEVEQGDLAGWQQLATCRGQRDSAQRKCPGAALTEVSGE